MSSVLTISDTHNNAHITTVSDPSTANLLDSQGQVPLLHQHQYINAFMIFILSYKESEKEGSR